MRPLEAGPSRTFQGCADGTAYITVTTTESPSLDPSVWVYGPESCIEGIAFDNFPCTLGTSSCPSMSVATTAAQYLLVVNQTGNCGITTGDPGGYRLDISASWDPKLTQIRDDLRNEDSATLKVVGTATLTK